MHGAQRHPALGGDVPGAVVTFVIRRKVAEADVAAVGEVAALVLDRAGRVAIADVHVAERRRVQRAVEIIEVFVQVDRRIARVVGRDRQIEQVVIVGILRRQLDEPVRQIMFDVGADLAALVAGETGVAITVVIAQEAADRIIGVTTQRTRLIGVEPVIARVADRRLHFAACGIGAGHLDHVGDRRRGAGVDRRRAAAHDLDPVGHQVEPVHSVALVEEPAVEFLEQRQAVLLIIEEAAIGRNAADAGDVLHLAAGRLDMDAGQRADQVGRALGRQLLDIGLRQRIDRVGDVEAALLARGAGDDDVGRLIVLRGCGRSRSRSRSRGRRRGGCSGGLRTGDLRQERHTAQRGAHQQSGLHHGPPKVWMRGPWRRSMTVLFAYM